MKYPKLSEDLDKRKKLNLIQIEEIKKLHGEGWSLRKIAIEFGVSKTIIRYHVVDQAVRKEINKKRYERIKEVEMFNPDIAEKRKTQSRNSYKEVLRKNPELRKYKGKQTYAWKKKKYHTDEEFREKTRQQAKEPSRKYFKKRWDTDLKFREYINEKNKQNYIKRNID